MKTLSAAACLVALLTLLGRRPSYALRRTRFGFAISQPNGGKAAGAFARASDLEQREASENAFSKDSQTDVESAALDRVVKEAQEIVKRRLRDAFSKEAFQPRDAVLAVRRAAEAFVEAQEKTLVGEVADEGRAAGFQLSLEETPETEQLFTSPQAMAFSVDEVWKDAMDSANERLSRLKKKAAEKAKKTAAAAGLLGEKAKDVAEKLAQETWEAIKKFFKGNRATSPGGIEEAARKGMEKVMEKTSIEDAARKGMEKVMEKTSIEDAARKGMEKVMEKTRIEDAARKGMEKVMKQKNTGDSAGKGFGGGEDDEVQNRSIEDAAEKGMEKIAQTEQGDSQSYEMKVRDGTDMNFEPKAKPDAADAHLEVSASTLAGGGKDANTKEKTSLQAAETE